MKARCRKSCARFISNALKFTDRGEIRVKAEPQRGPVDGNFSRWPTPASASPSKIREDLRRNSPRVENPVQRKVKGTGLGLPLCRKLGHFARRQDRSGQPGGHRIDVQSYYSIQYVAAGEAEPPDAQPQSWEWDETRLPVLVLDDEPATQLI